ncbi:MAG: aspartate-semialdehyde dehydrogenase [SAR202 cluster bacterium]|nr:aspartate-semialdehyde dehydrogenase [SAR202 cluster bacterium]
MAREVNIAVVGATGAVGREFLKILEQRPFPINHLKLLASHRSAGKRMSVAGQEMVVQETKQESFKNVDIAFISVSSTISKQLQPFANERGCLVIDDSSAFRMRDDVPLVIPEVNGKDVEWHRGIISIPNCSTTQLVMALHPLHKANPIKRVVVDTYQAVSGAGGQAVTELNDQSVELLGLDLSTTSEYGLHSGLASLGPRPKRVDAKALPHQIAFNLVPQIGSFAASGYSEEEEKMIAETCKIMHDSSIKVSATCVRVPVYTCHSEAVHVEFQRPMSVEEARRLLSSMPGVTVVDEPGSSKYPMPWDLGGTDDVYVGRIRRDPTVSNGLAMWVVSDNLRKGAALNALQIAEEVLKRGCLKVGKDSASARGE